ncbi:GPW/gp25 family protein [Polaromonas sp.]|uniref:GPW/gp25 family protein n=1 Tax=Polaromonas sp. TaxID=1869339 RepID=UPI003750A6CE
MVTSDINNLPNRFFQPALSSRVGGHASSLASDRMGELVTDIQDLDQCIRIILTTPKGSDPHRPLFGSNLHLYIDYPVNSARPHIVREAVNALREWEPRIEVVKVAVSLVDVAALACVVEWKFAAGVAAEAFVTNLALGVAK